MNYNSILLSLLWFSFSAPYRVEARLGVKSLTKRAVRLSKMLPIFFLLLQNCKSPENKKLRSHSLRTSLPSVVISKVNSTDTFHNQSFLTALDTMKFAGGDVPARLSLLEYYSGSSYTVTHLKYLLANYPKMGRIYFFKLNDNKWELKWCREMTNAHLDSLEAAMKKSINEDRGQLLKDSSNFRWGDLARFSIKDQFQKHKTSSIILNWPGDNLLNTLTDLNHK